MPFNQNNPQIVHKAKKSSRGVEWAKNIHKDLVAQGKRSEVESEEHDIVEEVKEVIQEVAEKTTEQ
jgi:hypothetical protein